jgi:PTS system mannose-specific IIB component/fructoselysine and glucoselysine-specific PTS system IIB component
MPILLYRVDDRLVHGQVVVGWGQPLGIDRIVLVDDEVAVSRFEQELYRMAVPPEMAVEFLTPSGAGPCLAEWERGPERVLVLVGSVDAAARLHGCGSGAVRRLNLGGIHHAPGRREYLRFVYLSDEEAATLAGLAAAGVEVTAQDVPTSRPVRFEEFGR